MLPSVARSLITRNTDHGMPRVSQSSAIAAVSMSSETTPWARSPAMCSASVRSTSVVHIFPCDLPSPNAAGRCSVPVALLTTTSGRMSVPIGVSFSTAPVMPTTTTRSTDSSSSMRRVPSAASSVPIPVTMATTSRPPSVPVWTVTPPISVL